MEETRNVEAGSNDESEEKKRSVVIARTVKVLFRHKSGKETETTTCNRDVYSVTDAIGSKLESLGGKDEMDDILVSVHSVRTRRSPSLPRETSQGGRVLTVSPASRSRTSPFQTQ